MLTISSAINRFAQKDSGDPRSRLDKVSPLGFGQAGEAYRGYIGEGDVPHQNNVVILKTSGFYIDMFNIAI